MAPPTTEIGKTWARILAAAQRVSRKWQEIREHNHDAPWDDFSFYKGNARWANGAAAQLAAMDPGRFPSALAACDEARAFARSRRGDPDYDEPTAALSELLSAIDQIAAALAAPSPAERLGLTEKRISLDELGARMRPIIDDIVASGAIYRVEEPIPPGTFLPSGMTPDSSTMSFVLGPAAICGQVCGLVDAEYGWPAFMTLDEAKSPMDLAPGYRHHPFILPCPLGPELAKKQGEIVVSIMLAEYEDILARMLARAVPPQK